jgi:cell division septal protein FtsQ
MARTRRAPKRNRVIIKYLQMILMGIFVLSLLFVIGQRSFVLVKRARMFQIREIVIAPNLPFIKPQDFSGFKGQSIFDVPLKKVQGRLRAIYPQADQLRVIRKFPDALYIVAKRRDPFVMLMRNSNEVVLDEESVVVTIGSSPAKQLPLITGITTVPEVSPGRAVPDRGVRAAIAIVRAMNENKSVADFNIVSVDIMNLSRIQVTLQNGLKVIFDQEKIVPKVDQLALVLAQPDLQLSNIDYIDLRFKEPLLGQKDLPKKNKH